MKNAAKTANSPTGNILTLPARWYHDPAIYEAERKAVFFDEWLLFGHESRVRDPGAYHAQNIAGWPVFVIRGKDGQLRGFHNVCRHRASQVLREGCGKAGVLRCLYHGWVYDDQGNLRKTPGFGGDEAALCENTTLFPVHVKVWNSLIFICMKEGTPPSFEKSIGALPEAVKAIDFAEFHFFEAVSHPVKCNWKAYMENYLEGYHVPAVHPGLNAEIDFSTYQVEVAERIALHKANTKTADAVSDGVWVWLWPNTALNIYRNGMNIEIVLPEGTESASLNYCYLFRDTGPAAEQENRRTVATSQSLTAEDIEVCEIVQRNLRAGIYERGELSPRHEQGVAYFQKLVAEAIRQDPGR